MLTVPPLPGGWTQWEQQTDQTQAPGTKPQAWCPFVARLASPSPTAPLTALWNKEERGMDTVLGSLLYFRVCLYRHEGATSNLCWAVKSILLTGVCQAQSPEPKVGCCVRDATQAKLNSVDGLMQELICKVKLWEQQMQLSVADRKKCSGCLQGAEDLFIWLRSPPRSGAPH